MAEGTTTGAFPILSEEQIGVLRAVGTERNVAVGELVFRPGDQSYELVVVLAGRIDIVDDLGGKGERVIARHIPGSFLGELNMFTGQHVYLSGVVQEPGRILAVPAAQLRTLVGVSDAMSEVVLRTFLLRRTALVASGAGVQVVGSRFTPATGRIVEFLSRSRVPHTWLDVDADPGAEALLQAFAVAPDETPMVVFRGEVVLRNPSLADLAEALGLMAPGEPGHVYDVAVVGAGPAGLASAVYAASEGLDTVVVDSVATGGQAGTSSRIENYLGFPAGLSGAELAARAALQAQKFNATLLVPRQVTALESIGGLHLLRLADGSELQARAVVIATGAAYRRLPLERLAAFEDTGVYYAATAAEARLCQGSDVAVVGGGNSAGQAAVYLATTVTRVHLLVRRDLSATMSRYLIDQIEANERITVHPRTTVTELLGDTELTGVTVADTATGVARQLPIAALFAFIGAKPHTEWLRDAVALDEHGFILTGADLPPATPARSPMGGGSSLSAERVPLQTSRLGVYAVGDVRSGSIKRVATAVGEGAMAIRLVHDHLALPALTSAWPQQRRLA